MEVKKQEIRHDTDSWRCGRDTIALQFEQWWGQDAASTVVRDSLVPPSFRPPSNQPSLPPNPYPTARQHIAHYAAYYAHRRVSP